MERSRTLSNVSVAFCIYIQVQDWRIGPEDFHKYRCLVLRKERNVSMDLQYIDQELGYWKDGMYPLRNFEATVSSSIK